jgi:hypothetical protein
MRKKFEEARDVIIGVLAGSRLRRPLHAPQLSASYILQRRSDAKSTTAATRVIRSVTKMGTLSDTRWWMPANAGTKAAPTFPASRP